MAEQSDNQQPQQKHEKRHMSRGDKIFDAMLYGPINFLGTLVLTGWIAHALEYGFSRKLFNDTGEKLIKAGMSPKWARNTLMTITLFFGGTLMLLPVKIAENFKKPIINWLNGKPKDAPQNDQVEAPKQTWSSLGFGRVLAFATTFVGFQGAGMVIGKQFGQWERICGRALSKLFGKPPHAEGAAPLLEKASALEASMKGMKRGPAKRELEIALHRVEKEIKPLESTPYAFGKILALDIFATIFSSAILYIGSHSFARKHEEKIEAKAEAAQRSPSTNDVDTDKTPAPDADTPSPKILAEGVSAQKALSGASPELAPVK